MSAESTFQDALSVEQKTTRKFFNFSRETKLEEAIELFQRAAGQFRLDSRLNEQERCVRAAEAWQHCASCQSALKRPNDAGRSMKECAGCFINQKMWSEATTAIEQAAEYMQQSSGNEQQIGKLWMSMIKPRMSELSRTISLQGRELPQEILSQVRETIQCMRRAYEYLRISTSPTTDARDCLTLMSELQINVNEADKAIQNLEEIGTQCADNNLLRFSARKHLMGAILVALYTNDVVLARNQLAKCGQIDPTWEGTRESEFCRGLVAACETRSLADAQRAVGQFTSVMNLDPWLRRIVNIIIQEFDSEDAILEQMGLADAPAEGSALHPAAPQQEPEQDVEDLI